MSRWIPCKRVEFIRRLSKLGFRGPYSGARHQFMMMGDHRLAIPSNSEYSVAQVRFMVREVELILGRPIGIGEWTRLS